MVNEAYGSRRHRERLGGNHIRVTRDQKYRVPGTLVQYLLGYGGVFGINHTYLAPERYEETWSSWELERKISHMHLRPCQTKRTKWYGHRNFMRHLQWN